MNVSPPSPLAECSGQEDERPVQRGRRRVVHHGHSARQELPALHVLRRLPRRTRLEVRVMLHTAVSERTPTVQSIMPSGVTRQFHFTCDLPINVKVRRCCTFSDDEDVFLRWVVDWW